MKVKTKRLLAGFCAAAMAFSTAFAVSAADTNVTSMPDLPTEDEVDDVQGVPMYVNGKDFKTGDELPSKILNVCKDSIETIKNNNHNCVILDYSGVEGYEDEPYVLYDLEQNQLTEDGWLYYKCSSEAEWPFSDENGDCYAVTGYVGYESNIKIPEEINGLPVKVFGYESFSWESFNDDHFLAGGGAGYDGSVHSFYVGTVNVRIAVPDHITNFAGLDVDILKNMGIRFVVNENTAAKDYFDKMGIDYDINNDDDSSDTSSDNSSDVSSDNSSDVSSDTTSNSDDSSNSSSDSSDASSAASSSKASSTSNKVSSSSTANPNTGAAAATFAGTAALGMAVVALRKKK